MELAFEFKYQVELKPPAMVGQGAYGTRMFFEVVGGTVEGERLKGKVQPGGGDWMLLGPDGWGRLDIRGILEADDGALIYLRYHGLLEMNEKVQQALASDAGTDFGDQYFRTTPVFETGDQRYAWLTQSAFVAEGRATPGSASSTRSTG